MTESCPSWLNEPCPAWCRADHQDQNHPDDRHHQGRQIFVPVSVPTPPAGRGASDVSSRSFEPDEMAVVALQPVGQTLQAWVAIVGERQFIEVTLESVVLLHAALGEILSEVR